jgi:hypothetical protein
MSQSETGNAVQVNGLCEFEEVAALGWTELDQQVDGIRELSLGNAWGLRIAENGEASLGTGEQ